MNRIKKLIGTKDFYRMVLMVAVPIMVQNGITNFVGLLDNIMVGQVGTAQMSGVAIVNNLIFVFNISIFGAISGAGIFGAQFFGSRNYEGIRNTFRFKILSCLVLTIIGFVVFSIAGDRLISLYLTGSGDAGDIAGTLGYGREYLGVMLIGLIPFVVVQIYSSTLRETGETVLPMIAGIVAVFVNLVFNYILIFGNFGAPRLGVAGAAVATVLSRFVECFITVFWTHRKKQKNQFIIGVYSKLTIPRKLTGQILMKGSPLMLNEVFWSAGMAVLLQCYSYRGLTVVAGMNISSTVANVFNVVFLALGSSVSIIIGQLLGAGRMEEARDKDYKLLFFSVVSCFLLGTLMAVIAPFFPRMYNTAQEVRHLATWFIWVEAFCMPMNAFVHAAYFTLRSGGKTIITFLFDSVFIWVLSIPVAFCLSRYTGMPVVALYFSVKMLDLIKCVIGYVLIKKGIWLHNMVLDEK